MLSGISEDAASTRRARLLRGVCAELSRRPGSAHDDLRFTYSLRFSWQTLQLADGDRPVRWHGGREPPGAAAGIRKQLLERLWGNGAPFGSARGDSFKAEAPGIGERFGGRDQKNRVETEGRVNVDDRGAGKDKLALVAAFLGKLVFGVVAGVEQRPFAAAIDVQHVNPALLKDAAPGEQHELGMVHGRHRLTIL